MSYGAGYYRDFYLKIRDYSIVDPLMFENLPNDIILDILQKRRLIKEKERLTSIKKVWLIELKKKETKYWMALGDINYVDKYIDRILRKELLPYKLRNR